MLFVLFVTLSHFLMQDDFLYKEAGLGHWLTFPQELWGRQLSVTEPEERAARSQLDF